MYRKTCCWLILAICLVLIAGCCSQNTPPELRLGIATDIGSLDPLAANSSHSAATLVFETLIRKDGTTYLPVLAAGWQASQNQTVWDFTLRPGIRFTNGTPLDAESVKFSLDRYCRLRQGKGGLADVLAKTEVLDPGRIRITLHKPYAPLLDDLCRHGLAIIAADCVEPRQEPNGVWIRAIGTGPFILQAYRPEQQSVFARNDNYWGEKAKLPGLVLQIIPDEESRALALESGQIDLIYANWDGHGATLPYRQALSLEQKGYAVITGDSSINKLLVFNTFSGPLRNTATRAYIYELLRPAASEILNGLLAPGEAKPAAGLFAETIGWPEGSVPGPQLVGKPQHLPEKLRVLVCSSEPHDLAIAQLLQACLAKNNISLAIQQADLASFWEFVDKKEYDLTLLATMGTPYDPWGMLNWGFAKSTAAIYYTPELGRQIEQLHETTMPAQASLQQAINKLLSDSYAFLPLYQEKNLAVMQPAVNSFDLYPGQSVLLPWTKLERN